MAKLLKGYAWLLVVLIGVSLVAGLKVALAIFIAFVGLVVALRNGYFRTISSEQFVLYDYHGRKRAQLAGTEPPAGHVLGADWDPVPGLDLYYRTGEKAASLTVDFHDGEGSSGVTLYRVNGLSAIGIINRPQSQGLFFKSSGANGEYELRMDNADKLVLVDSLGKERRIV